MFLTIDGFKRVASSAPVMANFFKSLQLVTLSNNATEIAESGNISFWNVSIAIVVACLGLAFELKVVQTPSYGATVLIASYVVKTPTFCVYQSFCRIRLLIRNIFSLSQPRYILHVHVYKVVQSECMWNN